MNAQELFLANGKPAGVWYCEKCKYVKRTQGEADDCCKQWQWVCKTCGKDVRQFTTKCNECQDAERNRFIAEQLAAAEIVESWDGWVFSDEHREHKDGYFESVEELIDYVVDEWDYDDGPPVLPEFVFCCKPQQLKADIENIIDPLCDEGWEDMGEYLDVKELREAIDKFNELNKDVLTVQYVDRKRKTRVRQ